jgi:hypothetical protein
MNSLDIIITSLLSIMILTSVMSHLAEVMKIEKEVHVIYHVELKRNLAPLKCPTESSTLKTTCLKGKSKVTIFSKVSNEK